MDFPTVQAQLNDLPPTFKRLGAPYTQWIDSLTSGLFLFTQAVDAILAQLSFGNSQYGWVDVWGTIVDVPRRAQEADQVYKARIQNTILSRRGTPLAIIQWLSLIELVIATISENFPAVGYSLTFPPSLTPAQVQAIVNNLAAVRPAGVPFQVFGRVGGIYLNTVNYLGGTHTTGNYIAGNGAPLAVSIEASTNNSTSILPTLLLTDPTINSDPQFS
jgi:hypothetical protein